MKIIEPSFEVIEEYFKNQDILSQIERCGRVCYKSEDRITKESAIPFIEGIIRRGHESVLEMAALVYEVSVDTESTMARFFERNPRFFNTDKLDRRRYLLSANVRAYRDMFREGQDLKVMKALIRDLHQRWPILFEDLLPKHGLVPQEGIKLRLLSPQEIDSLPIEYRVKHRYLLVRFTINRAVSHELVRHRVASYLQESQRYCRYGDEKFGGVTFIKPVFYPEGSPEYQIWKEACQRAEEAYLQLLTTSSPQAARTVLPNSCKTEIITFANLLEWLHILRLRTSKAADPSMRQIMLLLLEDLKDRFPEIFGSLEAEA
ncbi:FAD-dependent thymidylate synthase [Thermosulfuriphilus sp.]